PVRARPDGSGIRIFVGVWYVVLGASTTVLPPGPLSPEDPLVWLRGLTTVVCGLALLWLAPIENRLASLLGHLLIAAVQGAIAIVMIDQPGALTPSFTLLVIAIATAALPLYTIRRSGPLAGLPVYPLGV